ncbi:hypothetical protein ACWKTZ_21445 [Bacillus cereus]
MGTKIKLKPTATKKYSDENFTVGDYVVCSVLPHLKLRIDGIIGGGYYSVIKLGETKSKPAIIFREELYLEKPSPLRYVTPRLYPFMYFYHIQSKDEWRLDDVIVSHKGHRFDKVACSKTMKFKEPMKTEEFLLQEVMLIRQAHCKNGRCKAPLDIYNNRGVCPDCGWFVCHKCGSHGCDEITADTKVRDYLCYLRELKNPNFRLEQGPFTPITNE